MRSRLRLGYTKEQLEELFPDRLEFSRFQIDRVAQRNYLTQKLMNMVGMEDDGTLGVESGSAKLKSRRVAGSKGSEYVLQKNANGWTLALEGNKNDVVSIDIDETEVRPEDLRVKTEIVDEDSDEEQWEDVKVDVPEEEIKAEASEELKGELPGVLSGFGDQLLRQQLYDKLVSKATGRDGDDGLYDASTRKAEPKNSYFVFEDDEQDEQDNPIATRADLTDNGIIEDDLELGASIFSKKKGISQAIAAGSKANSKTLELPEKKSVPEVLPPWFFKQSQNQGIENVSFQEPEETNNEHNLITVEELEKERGVVQFYDSDDDIQITESRSKPNSLPRSEQGSSFLVISDESEGELEEVHPSGPVSEDGRAGVSTAEANLPIAEEVQISAFAGNEQLPTVETGEEVENIISEVFDSEASMQHAQAVLIPTTNTQPEELRNQKEGAKDMIFSPPKDVSEPAPSKYTIEHETELAEADLKFAQEEDEELLELLEKEEEENQRFAAELASSTASAGPSLVPPVYLQPVEAYDAEILQLKQQARKEQRDSDEVTESMVTECQELLRRFGIPYITAPMEAEAQCAALQELGLVDGIVTDDSDCFLFGGRRIFKNMFSNANKYVECYDVNDLEREFGLDRSKMVRLALLLGSDYTEGVTGVGPVTAMEILAEFDNGLEAFRDWWEAVQLKIKTPTDDTPEEQQSDFKKKFRKNARKIFLPANFPDSEVADAYMHPEVDQDPTDFEWGIPDLDSIRSFMDQLVGWDEHRTDQVLVPVIKSMNARVQGMKQKTMGDYFLFSKSSSSGETVGESAPGSGVGKSSRLKKALEKMGAKQKRKQSSQEQGEASSQTPSMSPIRKKGKKA